MLIAGVRKLVKYTKIYSNNKPVIHDEDIFRVIIPTPQATLQATLQVTEQDERTKKILLFCKTGKNNPGIKLGTKLGVKISVNHILLEVPDDICDDCKFSIISNKDIPPDF